MNTFKHLTGKSALGLCSVLMIAAAGCHGGPPRLPGLPGLPGIHHGLLKQPPKASATVAVAPLLRADTGVELAQK